MCSSLIGIGLRVRNVLADVVFDQFSGQPSDSTPNRRDQVQDLPARSVTFQRSFHRLDLSLEPPNAGEQLVFMFVDMAHKAEAYPAQLSGGEKQRLAVAAATIRDPEVLILDEPTSGLDGKNMRRMASSIRQAARDGAAVIVITHDLELMAAACTCKVVLPSQ